MPKKKVEYFNIEIEINGEKYTGRVKVEGIQTLYPTVFYGRKSIKGNPFQGDQFDSMMSYCRVILKELVTANF